MPKQRNHPHRFRGQRRDGVELPRPSLNPMAGVPRYVYPPGWAGKPLPRRMRVTLVLLLGAAATLLLLAVVLGMLLRGG